MPWKELVGATIVRQGRPNLLTSRLPGVPEVSKLDSRSDARLMGPTPAAGERWQNITRTLQERDPGNKGPTATPTAAVVVALFAQVALVQLWIGDQVVMQVYGLQPHHLLICDALGLDSSWYEAPSAQKNGRDIQTP